MTFRAALYADHRAGWSGLQMTVSLGWWVRSIVLFKWRTGYTRTEAVWTLADQIRETHRKGPTLEEQEEWEAEEKADERRRMGLFDKQLREWDARHQQPEN